MVASHTIAPVFMSSASRCASSVVMNRRSPSTPKPLLTRPQHAVSDARRRQLAAVAPDFAAAARVDRPRHVERAGHVQDVVAQERRRLEPARRVGLEYPLRHQPSDILGRDLRQRTVTLVGVAPAKRDPAGAVGRKAVEQLLLRDERRRRPAPVSEPTRIAAAATTSSERRNTEVLLAIAGLFGRGRRRPEARSGTPAGRRVRRRSADRR